MSVNVGELIATTIANRSRELADIVTDHIPLLYFLKQAGNYRSVSGGNVIYQELEYADNATFMWFGGADPLNVSESSIIDTAQYSPKEAAVAIVTTNLQKLQNAGKERMIDWAAAKVKNAERTLMNGVDAALYSDGTGSGSKEIGGLQHIVADTNTNTVGSISGTTHSWWRNYVYDFSDNSVAAGPTTIMNAMNTMHLNTLRNGDQIKLFIGDNTYFSYFEQALQAIQRITSVKEADAGFQVYSHKGAKVLAGQGASGNCPANHMYGLNTDYLFFRPYAGQNFEPIGSKRESLNQAVEVQFLGFTGNLTCSNRQLQAVAIA